MMSPREKRLWEALMQHLYDTEPVTEPVSDHAVADMRDEVDDFAVTPDKIRELSSRRKISIIRANELLINFDGSMEDACAV